MKRTPVTQPALESMSIPDLAEALVKKATYADGERADELRAILGIDGLTRLELLCEDGYYPSIADAERLVSA